ncbi:hypothetical protein U0070_020738 [Myodes glareolus]|uniref:Uncharacterized protein n=1 Tax=Myodes glareolus TaxID=447135 RepID=A0AAW0HPY4_MYOGA
MFYEGLKRQLLKKRMKLSSLDVFIIGAIAKAVATTVTYPMQTVQSILRMGGQCIPEEGECHVKSFLHLRNRKEASAAGRGLPSMSLEEPEESCGRFGIMGLYKGLEAKLLQTVLTAALMFLVYEKLTAATFTVMGLKSTHKH